jgi:hypothetical protein
VIHDLRHTHVSGLIADGWDVAEIAARIGDSIETTLRVYSHAFDARRRGSSVATPSRPAMAAGMATRRPGMATNRPSQTATARP